MEEHALEARQMLENRREHVIVCEAGGELKGFVEARLREYAEGCVSTPVGYLEGWYVSPSARRQGIGRALVEAAEQWARAQGCSEMASDAILENDMSHAAHRRIGFAEVERIVCYRKSL
jgi:aminoglycoside 6'-N-acetyltransferase I